MDNEIEKPKKTRVSADEKMKVLLDEQYAKIEAMINDKLEHVCYRVYKSFEAELHRQLDNHYEEMRNFE